MIIYKLWWQLFSVNVSAVQTEPVVSEDQPTKEDLEINEEDEEDEEDNIPDYMNKTPMGPRDNWQWIWQNKKRRWQC